MRGCRRALLLVLTCWVGIGSASCGAGDAAAPDSVHPAQVGRCPPLDTIVPKLLSFLRAGGFEGARAVIEDELARPGILRNALGATYALLRDHPPAGAMDALRNILAADAAEPMVSLLRNSLRYVDGDPALTQSDHYGLFGALQRSSRSCELDDLLLVLEATLTLRHPVGCERGQAGCNLWVGELVSALHDLIGNPALEQAMLELEFQDVLSREGFARLMKHAVTLMLSAGFEFKDVRDLLEANLGNLVEDPAAQAQAERLLGLLEVYLEPEAGAIAGLRSALQCLEQQDPELELYSALYDLVVIRELGARPFLGTVESLIAVDGEERLALYLVEVSGALRASQSIQQALLAVVDVLFDPRNARRVVPTLTAMFDQGVMDELGTLLESSVLGCEE